MLMAVKIAATLVVLFAFCCGARALTGNKRASIALELGAAVSGYAAVVSILFLIWLA